MDPRDLTQLKQDFMKWSGGEFPWEMKSQDIQEYLNSGRYGSRFADKDVLKEFKIWEEEDMAAFLEANIDTNQLQK